MCDAVSVARVLALTVVGEHFDDAAVGNRAMRAFHHHALQLCLESGQAGKATFDLDQLCLGDCVGGLAGLVGSIR